MKTGKLLLILACLTILASCKKTYVCKDQYDNAIGEVKASSQSKADALCPSGSHGVKK